MKKKISVIFIVTILALTLTFVFVGCENMINNNNNNNSTSAQSSELIAVSATSSALILDNMQSSTSGIALGRDDDSLKGKPLTDEEIEEVKAQLSVLENYIGDNAPSVTQSTLSSGDAYFGEYEYKMVVVTKDMHGNDYEYTLYFNQEKIGEKTEYDDDDDKLSTGNQEFEFAEEFKLTGIVVSGENTYELSGIKENKEEFDDGQKETESTYKMTIKKSQDEYVVFEQSLEEEDGETEQKYEYKIYSQGKLVKEFSIEFEKEFGEQEVEMKSIENGQIFQVSYESEVINGKERIKAEVLKDNKIVEVIIRVEGSGTEEDPYRHIYTYGEIEDIEYDD